MSRKKLQLIEIPDDYTTEAMFKELNTVITKALQLGQTAVALQAIMVKSRVSGVWDAFAGLPKGKVTGINNGQVEVVITDYKSITNRVGTPDVMETGVHAEGEEEPSK